MEKDIKKLISKLKLKRKEANLQILELSKDMDDEGLGNPYGQLEICDLCIKELTGILQKKIK